jgi:hypothetical protein
MAGQRSCQRFKQMGNLEAVISISGRNLPVPIKRKQISR